MTKSRRRSLIERVAGLPPRSTAGSLLRVPLAILPRSAALPIIQGPLRGTRWVVGAGIHSCWLGTYERAVQETLLDLVRPDSVAYDVGAHAGYHTLLLSRAVSNTGHVYAFEPDAINVAALKH